MSGLPCNKIQENKIRNFYYRQLGRLRWLRNDRWYFIAGFYTRLHLCFDWHEFETKNVKPWKRLVFLNNLLVRPEEPYMITLTPFKSGPRAKRRLLTLWIGKLGNRKYYFATMAKCDYSKRSKPTPFLCWTFIELKRALFNIVVQKIEILLLKCLFV